MAVLKCEPLIKELATNKPNAATAFNLSGTGVTNFRAFTAAYANTETLPVFAKNTDGSLWEESICTFTSGTPNTLVRTTILKSSNANAAVDFSGSATDITLAVGFNSMTGQVSHATNSGYIRGGTLGYSSATAITISACSLSINNKLISSSGTTTLTSGSTMLDLAGSTVTLGASKAYFVFAFNNAGTLAFRVEDIDGTGDGANLIFDSDLDYWKAASTGANARRIGKFWTNASSQVIEFLHVVAGRYRKFTLQRNGFVLLANGASATYASAGTLTPFFTPDALEMALITKPATTSSFTLGGAVSVFLSLDGGTTDHSAYQFSYSGYNGAAATNLLGVAWYPNTGSLHYKVTQANTQANIDACGFAEYV